MILTLTSWSRGGDHYSSCAWPVFRARGSSLYRRVLPWVPELADPPPSVSVGFYTNTFQVDGPVPFCESAFKHQLPCSWYQRDFFFEWVGEYLSEDERWLKSSSPYWGSSGGRSSSWWGRSRYSNVEGVSWHRTILPNTSGAVTNS